jgi:hypothetical protein
MTDWRTKVVEVRLGRVEGSMGDVGLGAGRALKFARRAIALPMGGEAVPAKILAASADS